MPSIEFLHHHPDFSSLLQIVADEKRIAPALVEKDYWIMHCLYGLQKLGLAFELKGGTSLSKGYGVIHRFSEDIDIRIEPPPSMNVKTGRNHDAPEHCASRQRFYDWLAETIKIDGMADVRRDTAFDDLPKYRSGGIRLHYKSATEALAGLKDGVLLELGFDDVAPNTPKDISSWAYDYAASRVSIIDNRAKAIACYHPGHTLVEKLQTISTKYRQQQTNGSFPANFMRHYYDVYCLLQNPDVLSFIGAPEYTAHKKKRFRSGDDPVIAENEAFLLNDHSTRSEYAKAYEAGRDLYYAGQPEFAEVLSVIRGFVERL